ncbi:DUF6912 family protein [Streptomyces sp. TP-A0874]|uniref:DUF6912 family protein n=1 Tax=Streptomyces sp. TP-A0874 TaxID=549819 RepID=UPI000853C7EB|nr:hypothetical protein [Streptomyces sp. TP-A0874]
MRVYVPTTLSGLAGSARAGEIGPGPVLAHAVTPGLREWYLSDNVEELEYAALTRAAQSSLRLLAADPEAARRRVVIALDVPEGAATADPEGAAAGVVRISEAAPLSWVAAVHVDADGAERDIAGAARALDAADRGDADARLTVDGAEDHELLWYATQEIPILTGE